MSLRVGLSMILLSFACFGCGAGSPTAAEGPGEPAPDGPEWFEDVTERTGVRFTHSPGPAEKCLMYEITTGGCAIEDLDGDGRLDIVLLTCGGPGSTSKNALFKQKPDGTFADVSAGSGIDFAGWTMGIAIGDVNRDGRPDVVITEAGRTRLLINRGGMKFQDVSSDAGIRNPLWSTAAAFFDYDRDGWLDLFVVNYVDYNPTVECRSAGGVLDYCGPQTFPGTSSKLFRNRGAGAVAFEDVSVSTHIGDTPGPGLGIAVADFDGDGWPDVFVANDGQPNRMWMNRAGKTFTDEAAVRGVAFTDMGQAFAGMGIAIGDTDNDGLQDLYVTHLGSESNTLWMQAPRGRFRDMTNRSGLLSPRQRSTGFGALFADFDQDGKLDLAVVNGRVIRDPDRRPRRGLDPRWLPYSERNQLFQNVGGGRFREISHNSKAFGGYDTVARGLACGDLDGDGAPDLLVNAIGEHARVLKNVVPARGRRLTVRAVDPDCNGPSIGAEVIVRAAGTSQVRVVASALSYLTAVPAVVHFGFGAATAYDAIEVLWPDGTRERFPGGATDRSVEVRKGSGSPLGGK